MYARAAGRTARAGKTDGGEAGRGRRLAGIGAFVTAIPSNSAHARTRPAWTIQDKIRPETLTVDDTGFLKGRDASPCVSRPYTGTTGKVSD
ncbi:transposase [Streptomyces sp. NBC_00654]|uniref:transposase n=1 Tax=Streptomyces sp. NBC_00654 TaxID=2975799 RepID=UPI0022582E71|nr:transposase [Streptomyces sp. NBC_00654]MCX4966862.1 transposase [Streptomyces sp. NBC_00654]